MAYFGKPDSGKSYDLRQYVKTCGMETIFVYNAGWDRDWVNFEEIELWSDKNELYFNYKGKDYLFGKYFMKKFKGKRVKAMMADETRTQQLLYKALVKRHGENRRPYAGLFFIIDDATNIINVKMTQAEKACFYRAKHVGIWFATIFHNIEDFPNRGWNALTRIRIFKNLVPPPIQKRRIIPHFRKIFWSYNFLLQAPRFSYCTIDMDTGKHKKKTYSGAKKTASKKTTKTKKKP